MLLPNKTTGEVYLQPGQMVLYEGAWLRHGRPMRFKGDMFANIFTHFSPIDWRGKYPRRRPCFAWEVGLWFGGGFLTGNGASGRLSASLALARSVSVCLALALALALARSSVCGIRGIVSGPGRMSPDPSSPLPDRYHGYEPGRCTTVGDIPGKLGCTVTDVMESGWRHTEPDLRDEL